MDVEWFDFALPEHLIAQTPLLERTGSRLLTLNKLNGDIGHHRFESLIQYLRPGDALVINDTKVIPARLFGTKMHTGAKAEVLLLKNIGGDRWEALVKPGKRLRKGAMVGFGAGPEPLLRAEIVEEGDMGRRIVHFRYEGIFNVLLDELGQMPLPPYIKQQLEDRNRYQTVYARAEGSAAAPTAGLHFTEDYLIRIREHGVRIAPITLHVGLGTFRPVAVQSVEEHEMHEEYYEMSEDTARILNETRKKGGRVIAVGTTSARTLESVAGRFGTEPLGACSGWTNIFIYPGYTFRLVDALLTNFHLPKSTLVMLVSALAGRERVLHAYKEAVAHEYRFFSFGDAMFIY